MKEWISRLFDERDLTRMGHLQRVEDANLGLGWIYYGLARVIRPKQVVVIGSFRGFVPLVLGKALADNMDGGRVAFIDPSFIDDFWKDPKAVRAYFERFDVANIDHFLMTTQQFTQSDAYRLLGRLGMVFIDGFHSEEQARFDFDAFESLVDAQGVILLHDTARVGISRMYGADRAYERRVKIFVDGLKEDARLQVFDLPFAEGVTLVRRVIRSETAAKPADASVPALASGAHVQR